MKDKLTQSDIKDALQEHRKKISRNDGIIRHYNEYGGIASVSIEVPKNLFEVKELEIFDNNIHEIIEEYSKLHLEKREQILTQRIIIKQEEELKKYKEVIDKAIKYNKKNIHSQTLSNILKGE